MEDIILKILIVDDDRKLLSVLKTILTKGKNDVSTCNDGQKAIELCRTQEFDLIITDLMMPGAGGLEVLKEARKIEPDTLVILITGFASLETAVQSIREGAYDYITKPFKLDEINIVVNNAREKIRLIRENRKLINELHDAYKQLNMMKQIIGASKRVPDISEENPPEGSGDKRPFIAGSMLPFYYADKVTDFEPPFLPDLERISALKERGLITDEEFILCKSKLFKNIKH